MIYDLPKSVEVAGEKQDIRTDFREILDIIEVLNDAQLTDKERGTLALCFFYVKPESIPSAAMQEAVEKLFWFIRGGEEEQPTKGRKLMDWQQDFRYIIAPINKAMGHDVRGDAYCHWWSFLSAYMEIGECLFSNILRIRQKQAEGKRLDKAEAEWYRKNRDIVDLKTTYTDAEKELLAMWGGNSNG